MNRKRRIALFTVSIVLTAVISNILTTAFYTGNFFIKPRKYQKLDEAYSILESKYYEDINDREVKDGAVKGMVEALNDPYTTYMSKSEWNDFNEMIQGSYSGLGITITADTKDDTILIVSPFDGSPAERAGLTTGDKILKVEGEAVTGSNLDAATAKMKGEPGTDVTITVLKADSGKAEDITLTREDIKIDTVYYEMDEDIAYMRISMFDVSTGEDFAKNLAEAIDKGAKSIILDLRQNGGGITIAAEKTADCLLPAGSEIYYTKNKQGKEVHYKTKNGGVDLPLVVLVDEGTASAAEILSSSIQENKRGVLVGKKTFGKGLVQQTFPLSDGSILKVTVERYFTALGNDINKKGITPDYDVELPKDSEIDLQYEKAKEILKENI